MEKYEVPEMDIIQFDAEAAIITSNCGNGAIPTETPVEPMQGV